MPLVALVAKKSQNLSIVKRQKTMKNKIKSTKIIGVITLFSAILSLYFGILSAEANVLPAMSFSANTESLPMDMAHHRVASPNENYGKNDPLRPPSEHQFMYNYEILKPFFEKLTALETFNDRKINIVHIGDSHIQADAMTNLVRQQLQNRFGNAGLGFVFPYSLIRTNGGRNVRFSSNITWDSQKITEAKDFSNIGLSGYSFTTKKKNFLIEIEVKNQQYSFNTLKIITPNNEQMFELATNSGTIALKPSQPKTISHKIKKGETLYAIAKKYKTTVAKIQKANNLKNTNIRVDATLKIPTAEMEAKPVDLSNFNVLSEPNAVFSYYMYENLNISDKIYLTPNSKNNDFSLNGIVLENNQSGVIYHNIGINGVRLSDYNKSQLFFQQLKALEPDLIIISLGTNESFGKWSAHEFYTQMERFMEAIRVNYGQSPVILTSPPPSLFKKQNPNPFPTEYANILIKNSLSEGYAVFDLYQAMGGSQAMERLTGLNLIAKDRVHYTANGYEEQGILFVESLLNNYEKSKMIY